MTSRAHCCARCFFPRLIRDAGFCCRPPGGLSCPGSLSALPFGLPPATFSPAASSPESFVPRPAHASVSAMASTRRARATRPPSVKPAPASSFRCAEPPSTNLASPISIAGDIAGESESTPAPTHCTRSTIILCSSSLVLTSASVTTKQPSRNNLHATTSTQQPSRLALRVTLVSFLVEDPITAPVRPVPQACVPAVPRRAMLCTTSRRRLITAHRKLAAKLRERPPKL